MPEYTRLLPHLVADLIGQLYGRVTTGDSLEQRNEADFLEFEAKFNQIFVLYTYSFQAIGDDIEDGVGAELEHFEELLRKSCDAGVPYEKGSLFDTTSDEKDGYPLVRGYVSHVVENGWVDEAFGAAFLPDFTEDLRKTTDKLATINNQASDSSHNTANGAYLTHDSAGAHAEGLYQLLVGKSRATLEHRHEVLLQLSGLHEESGEQARKFEILLSGCPDHRQGPSKAVWQDTLCTLNLDSVDDDVINGDLCEHIDHGQRYRIRLHLSFNQSTLWASMQSRQERTSCHPVSKLLSLQDILDMGVFSDDSLKTGVIKYRLALQLATGLQHLFMGPWLQKYWTADLVRFVGENGQRIRELARPFILCNLHDQAIQETDPELFLRYFAQLLVDIARGRQTFKQSPLTINQATLWEEAVNLSENRLWKYYGNAIKGCLHYQLDYNIEKRSRKDPKLTAQKVIGENIVSNLYKHLNEWQMAQEDDLRTLHFPEIGNNETGVSINNDTLFQLYGDLEQREVHTGHADDFPIRTRLLDEAEFTLFAENDALYETREEENPQNPFIKYMKGHIWNHVVQSPELRSDDRLRIAVLDTGLRVDESDDLLSGGTRRIIEQKNFVDSKSQNCHDSNGHGTHIVRILLRFAPRSQILVGKISEGKSMKQTRLEQLAKALEWAGEHADIISLSFGLGDLPKPSIQPIIAKLVSRGRLIFAAASNSGGNRGRAYPASQQGVFCIHATDANGDKARGMNPPALEGFDNFATWGVKIDSVWDNKKLYVSGTSFATPVAAAVAANALDYIRCVVPNYNEKRGLFFRYGFVRKLFRHMSRQSKIDGYHYIKPWASGLWDDKTTREDLCELFNFWAVGA